MSRTPLPLLRLEGTPDEVGEAHGAEASALIAHNLDVYFKRFAGEGELPRAEVLDRAQRYWGAIQTESPEFAAMIQGIARGAGQPLPEIVAINLRFEFLYGEFSRIGRAELGHVPTPADECTAFAVLPEASGDGHLRVGQNWDWIPEVAGVLQHVTRPDGLRALCFTEAGVAGGKIGMNSAGVGLVINGLLSNRDDWSRLGRPFHARTWDVLCSRTLADAARAVTEGVHSCSANFLIAQAGPPGEGTAVDIEAAPGACCHLEPRSGILVHANHFVEPDRLGLWQPIVEEKRSTYHRCRRMEALLSQAAGAAATDALMTILRDHAERPESICRHPNPALPEDERYETVVSVIMDLHAGRMHAAAGPPCGAVYHEYRL
ncbi:MAG: C45 family peptidase [Armatimonadota bacterium]|nr:C45 family peptidase [Armatimonadota bacterium]